MRNSNVRRPSMEDYDGRGPSMEDNLRWKTTFNGRRPSMEDDNEDDLKNNEYLHIAGRHTALDIFCFAVFFLIL